MTKVHFDPCDESKSKHQLIQELSRTRLQLAEKEHRLCEVSDHLMRSEQELKQAGILFSEAQRLLQIGFWEVDTATKRWSFSDEWLTMHGCRGQVPTADQWLDIVHPQDRADIAQAMEKTRTGKRQYDLEYRIARMDNGQVRLVHSRGNYALDASGKVFKIYGFTQDITARKRIEEAKRAGELHLRNVLNNMIAMIGLMTPGGILIEANRTALKVANLQQQDVFGLPLEESYWWSWSSEEQERLRQAIRKAAAGIPSRYDALLRIGEVEFRTIDFMLSPMFGDDGRVAYLIPSAIDITERKRAEQALHESEERLHLALKAAEQGTWELALDTRRVHISERAAEIFGLETPAQLTHQKDWRSVVFKEDQAAIKQAIEMGLQADGRYRFEYRIIRARDGVLRWVLTEGQVLSDGNASLRLIGIVRDITERKQAEHALQKNKERLELLANVAEKLLRSEDPQAIIEDLCRVVLTHLDCQFFFNYLIDGPDQNLVLNAFSGFCAEDAARIRKLDPAASSCGRAAKDGYRIIVDNIQHDDDPRTQLARAYGVQAYCCHPLTAQERVLGTLSFATSTRKSFSADEIALMKSVSDQVAVAIQRVQAEKMLQQLNRSLMQQVAERTALAEGRARQLQSLAVELIEAEEKERQRIALLLHDDLQQLLASANMQLQVVRKSMPQDVALDSIEKALSESISKSRHLSHELSPPVLQHSGIVAALQWLIRKMQEKFALTIQYRADVVECFDDATSKLLIFRAVQELLFNIVKHSEVKKASIDLRKSDTCLVICVSDQGKGFDPDILGDAKQWAGLGLVSLRERINYMGGTVEIESAPGKGCRFTLTLPFPAADAQSRTASSATLAERTFNNLDDSGDKIRVLLADDHKVMRQALVKLLSSQAAIKVVGEASDGRQAVELARQLRPDVALMDISMPEMDGIEATRTIKTENPDVRVIGLSMFEDEQAIQAMHAAGAEAYISKTASTSELLKAIYCAADRGKAITP
jgi:PAS domain S-box-containing protein